MILSWLVAASLPVASGGCPLPIPEADRADAGAEVNAPPLIGAATPEDLAFPGPLLLDRGDPRSVSVRVTDIDLEDTLHARFFRDYTSANPTPPVVSGTATATAPSTPERIVEVSVATWCAGLDPADSAFHTLEIMVTDRPFLPDGTPDAPLFRALPADALAAFRSWTIACNPPE
jgi:hypothetical protein